MPPAGTFNLADRPAARRPSPSRPTRATWSLSSPTPATAGCGSRAQATGHNAGRSARSTAPCSSTPPSSTGVSIDAAARRVRVGAATRWEEVAPAPLRARAGRAARLLARRRHRRLLARRRDRLARPQARHADQRVTAIELVTADGHLVRTDAVHEPELFWALRGGGGNFGVVTAIEFTVSPSRELYAGALFFPFERASEVLHAWTELLPTLPEELMSWAQPHPLPAAAGAARGRPRALVRRRQGGVPRQRGRGPRAAAAGARAGARDGHVRDGAAGRARRAGDGPARARCPIQSTHALLDELCRRAIDDLAADRRAPARRSRWCSCATWAARSPAARRARAPAPRSRASSACSPSASPEADAEPAVRASSTP